MLAAVPHPGGAVQGREELCPPGPRGLEDGVQETLAPVENILQPGRTWMRL